MTAWPTEAVITPAYSLRRYSDVERTTVDDGPVNQARLSAVSGYTREVRARIANTDLDAVWTWARANAHTWFDFADPHDGVTRKARIVGGFAGIQWRVATVTVGPAHWEMTCQVEGNR